MTKPRPNDEEFDARFDELAAAISRAKIEDVDAAYDALARFLEENESATIRFLKRATPQRLQTARAFLEGLAVVFHSKRYLDALVALRKANAGKFDFESEIEAARIALAEYKLNDDDASIDELTARAKKKDVEALEQLAIRYYLGNGVDEDREKATRFANEARELGSKVAGFLRDL